MDKGESAGSHGGRRSVPNYFFPIIFFLIAVAIFNGTARGINFGDNPGEVTWLLARAFITLALVTVTVTLASAMVVPRKRVAEGTTLGIIAGGISYAFLISVTTLVLQLDWRIIPEAIVSVFPLVLIGSGMAAIRIIFGSLIYLLVTAVLGAAFARILRTTDDRRTIAAGVFFGLSIWALLSYFILPFVGSGILRGPLPAEWMGIALGVFGGILGVLFTSRTPETTPLDLPKTTQVVVPVPKKTRKRIRRR